MEMPVDRDVAVQTKVFVASISVREGKTDVFRMNNVNGWWTVLGQAD